MQEELPRSRSPNCELASEGGETVLRSLRYSTSQPTRANRSHFAHKNRSSANFATKLSVQVQLIVELNVVLDGVDRAVSAGEALVVGAEEGEEYEEWELDTATGAMTRQ